MIATIRMLDRGSNAGRPLVEEGQTAEFENVTAAIEAAVDVIQRQVTTACYVCSKDGIEAVVYLEEKTQRVRSLRYVGFRPFKSIRRPRLDVEASGRGAVCGHCGKVGVFRAQDADEDEGIRPVDALRCRGGWRCGWCKKENPVISTTNKEAMTCASS